jgi:hypothetical protein
MGPLRALTVERLWVYRTLSKRSISIKARAGIMTRSILRPGWKRSNLVVHIGGDEERIA